jgi:superfamily II DNA or RNA helicase
MTAFALSPHLWAPQRRGLEMTIDALTRGKDVCLYGPTGSGKTIQAIELFRWANSGGWDGSFYVNRKLLIGQTAARFKDAGLHFGIRAADYEDEYRFDAPLQICSIDTERSRVLKKAVWELHDSGRGGLAVIDEAHIQKSQAMWDVIQEYKSRGWRIVLLTATPVGLSEWADELVVSGRMQEYRDCKALVPAIVKAIEQPDLRKVKRNATGEYVLDGEKKRLYTQAIVGNVIDRWKEFNPDAKPTMLYAPGKPESVWLTEQFQKAGVNWCHVDATDAVVDGKRAKLTRKLWTDDILPRYRAGEIKGLSCRFKLREGIDVPGTYHCILATPIGSLASYIQTVGRVLRYSPETPEHVIVTDHGGNYWRHGSPNLDRDWQSWWTLPEHAISEMHQNSIRDGNTPESIVCPRCRTERRSGHKCPTCGYEHAKSSRHIIMEDGRMEEHEGDLIPPRRTFKRKDTEELWEKMFWGFRRKKVNQTFNQMAAYFAHENHYQPDRDLGFMPASPHDWYRKVHEVPLRNLRGGEEYLARKAEAANARQ